ncbi:MAG: glycoside hydrolase 43 family protein, partial [Kiritimatiellae bacterium]|nr:glycoside hydrolase 43 family protein [Kiritimatiellia bacterium]
NQMNTLLACLLAIVNPIVDMDMSDPDCTSADGTNFYLTVSSFTDVPGLPIYHSTNLVNWRLVSHALPARPKDCVWTRRGQGVWAPAIRFHEGMWHVFWGDPDHGIFRTSAPRPEGPWPEPVFVQAGKGLIDPCPLWDDDGTLHIVNAFAASRSGFNSVVAVDGRLVYDGLPDGNHTIEGPKLYRHGGYYWIFAPAGGVMTGWQLALRSKNLYGPYEARIVLAQGRTSMNGPHQGAWVSKADGTDWFLHFQDKGYLGRVLCLQPMSWGGDGWPVIGDRGEPLLSYGTSPHATQAAILVDWVSDGTVFDFCGRRRLYSGGSVVTKFPSPSFAAKVKLAVTAKTDGAVGGILLAGDRDVRFGLALESRDGRFTLILKDGEEATRIGTMPAREVDAGALKAWTSDDVAMEVRVRPCESNPRECEVVLSCHGFKSGPVRLANSIWQGVKIGVAAEAVDSAPRNWVDLESFLFTSP